MKITKAMGEACLRELEDGVTRSKVTDALDELAGEPYWGYPSGDELATALAMCAAIAGVKP